jgi:hypothetical protein
MPKFDADTLSAVRKGLLDDADTKGILSAAFDASVTDFMPKDSVLKSVMSDYMPHSSAFSSAAIGFLKDFTPKDSVLKSVMGDYVPHSSVFSSAASGVLKDSVLKSVMGDYIPHSSVFSSAAIGFLKDFTPEDSVLKSVMGDYMPHNSAASGLLKDFMPRDSVLKSVMGDYMQHGSVFSSVTNGYVGEYNSPVFNSVASGFLKDLMPPVSALNFEALMPPDSALSAMVEEALGNVIRDLPRYKSPEQFGAAVRQTAPKIAEQVRSLRGRDAIIAYLNLLGVVVNLLVAFIQLAMVFHESPSPAGTTIVINNETTTVINLPPALPAPTSAPAPPSLESGPRR